MTFSSSSVLYPCPMPRISMAATVAIKSAINGSPRKPNTGWTPLNAGTTPETESRIMSTSGIKIIPTIVQKFGSLDSSKSSWFATCSGTGIWNFFPQMAPHTGPATIIETVPQHMPTKITHPRSTLSIVATRIGPGVGGINAWPTARPASSGMA